jgi:surface carbohydrate biosynthesis protein (TIGR04326 family)
LQRTVFPLPKSILGFLDKPVLYLKNINILIWDSDGDTPAGDWLVVLWRSYDTGGSNNVISIPKMVEDNAESLRARYLEWIYDLGETKVNGKRIVDHLEIRPGLSYWWITLLAEKCTWAKSPKIGVAIRLLAFDFMFRKVRMDRIQLVSCDRDLASSFRLWCKNKNLPFSWDWRSRKQIRVSWGKRWLSSIPRPTQALLWLLHCWFTRSNFRGVGVEDWRKAKGDVTFISYLFNLAPESAQNGRYLSPFWTKLPDILLKHGRDSRWLHFYIKDKTLPSAQKAAELLERFNKSMEGQQIHTTVDSFMSLGVAFRTICDFIRINIRGHVIMPNLQKRLVPYPYLWPLVKGDLEESFSGISAMKNMLDLNLFNKAIRSLPKQKMGIYLHENRPWEKIFLYEWKKHGHGKLIGVPHSSVRFWDLSYFSDPRTYSRKGKNIMPMPDLVALNGNAMKKEFLKGKYPRHKITDVEALRYLHLGNPQKRVSAFAMPGETPQLLVLGDYLEENNKMMLHLLELVLPSLNKVLQVTIKPHPACPIRSIEYPSLRLKITSEPIDKLLNKHSAVYTSSMTSAAVNAYCTGIQVISFLRSDTLNLSPLRGKKGVHFVATTEELKLVLEKTSNLPQRIYRKKTVFNSDNNLPRWKKIFSINSREKGWKNDLCVY